MTRNEIKRGLTDLRLMRKMIASGKAATVFEAWNGRVLCREMLLRHVRPGVYPFDLVPSLSHGDDIPVAHALKWIDTAIAYAEEHGR